MKIISNLSLTHGASLTELLCESYDELFLVSPFLAADFNILFGEDDFSTIRKVTLVTTLKKNDQDQITKPESLKSFYKLMANKCPKATVKIHIDNSLHGKIYIFKKDTSLNAIVTSANLTRSGFYNNHEWGLLIDDRNAIEQLENEVLENIEFPEITESLVDRLLMYSDQYQRNNPEWTKVNIPTSDILDDVYYQAHKNSKDPRYYLKPIGVSENPIWKERWPWHIEGRNLSLKYGGRWWEYDLERQSLLNAFAKQQPNEPVTVAGGKTLGTLNFGSDKVEITKSFADFLITKINEINNNN